MANLQHAVLGGLDLHEDKRIKAAVRAASTANVSLSAPGATLDGVTLATNDRVLLKDQTTASQNGIYTWTGAATALTRATDANVATLFFLGFKVYVQSGTANASTYWTFTQSATVTLETTSLTFVKDGGLVDPTTTKADLLTRTASGLARLGVGADGTVLKADSTQATGLAWGSVLTNPMTTLGDLIVGAASGVANRLGIGSQGQVLTADTGSTFGMKWASVFSNPMTTIGDIIVAGASGVAQRLGVGANGQVLGITSGIVGWINNPAGFSNPMTTIGDLITGGASGVAQRLAIGANGQVLTVTAGQPAWANATGGAGSTPPALNVVMARSFI